VFIWSHFRPTGKKTPWVSPPSEIYLFQTPLPLGISVTLHGGGGYGYFLELHNIQNWILSQVLVRLRTVLSIFVITKWTNVGDVVSCWLVHWTLIKQSWFNVDGVSVFCSWVRHFDGPLCYLFAPPPLWRADSDSLVFHCRHLWSLHPRGSKFCQLFWRIFPIGPVTEVALHSGDVDKKWNIPMQHFPFVVTHSTNMCKWVLASYM